MQTLRRRAIRPAAAVAGLAVAILALTACGGGSSAADTTSAAAPAASASAQAGGDAATGGSGGDDVRAAMETYRSCLADNGVTMPSFDGGPGGGGTPPSGMPSRMPSAAPGDGGTPPSGMPAGGPGGGFNQKPEGVDQDTWDAAVAACADVAPSFGPGQGAAGGGGQPDATALAAFKNCLTENGVTVADDDNWFRELDRSDATVAAAATTCAPLLPAPGADSAATPAATPAASS